MADNEILKEIRALQIDSLQRITATETMVDGLVESQEKIEECVLGNGGRGLMEASREHDASIVKLSGLTDSVRDNEERLGELEEIEANRLGELEKAEELTNAAKGDYRKTKLGLISAVTLAIVNALILLANKFLGSP